MADAPTVSELLAPFNDWLGCWEGEGRGLWLSETPFLYRETLTIEGVPDRALLRLVQRTWDLGSGQLSHSEAGFLRLLPERQVELVLAIPAGYVELHAGRLAEGILNLEQHSLSASPTARPLRLVHRRLALNLDSLRTSVGIAVGPEAVAPHVEANLHRAPGLE